MEISEIKSLMHSLEKAPPTDEIKRILDILDSQIKPTEKLLRETKLGVAVNKLRTHSDSAVAEKVKKIIKKWKDEVVAQKKQQRVHHGSSASTNSAATNSSASQDSAAAAGTGANSITAPESSDSHASAGPKFTTANGLPRNPKNDGISTVVYRDAVRDKCIELTYTSLAVDSQELPSSILECSKSVEAAVFKFEKGTTAGYKSKMRSLYLNLKDPKNPSLRRRVLLGEITPDRLYSMTPQEMASEELQKEMKELEKQNLFKAQGAKEKRATTDRFTCGKCKQKKVSYYQMQTRSADEPLTTFCTCENCGNRWKFS